MGAERRRRGHLCCDCVHNSTRLSEAYNDLLKSTAKEFKSCEDQLSLIDPCDKIVL